MQVGDNTYIYSYSTIDAGRPWLINIGSNVVISSGVMILTHDASTNIVKCGTKLGRVTIGNNTFIGANAIVLCNTRIGENVIVGAGSAVTHDLPSDAVYGGNSAQRICSIEDYHTRYSKLRATRPAFDKIRSWDTWIDATDQEKKRMFDELEDGIGFY